MASAAAEHITLARSLPSRLQRFFVLNPPKQFAASLGGPVEQLADDGRTAEEQIAPRREKLNPFMAHKNPKTGRWNPPIYSLRQQADIVKLAEKHGVEDLLPYTRKLTSEKIRRRLENGLRVKGTGIGQRVKGHLWERQLKSKLEKRRKAMLEMPQMIQTWKQRGHGRGWKKWPPK